MSKRRIITTDDLRTEWKRLLAPAEPIVPIDGMTLNDMCEMTGCPQTTMRERIKRLVKMGRMVQMGVRPGRSKSKVYQLTVFE